MWQEIKVIYIIGTGILFLISNQRMKMPGTKSEKNINRTGEWFNAKFELYHLMMRNTAGGRMSALEFLGLNFNDIDF